MGTAIVVIIIIVKFVKRHTRSYRGAIQAEAIKHPVSDNQVKPSFLIFDILAL